jgi:hypothetical protein
MSSTGSWRTSASALLLAALTAGCASETLRHHDDFRDGLAQWHIEAEKPATVTAHEGVLDIVAPAGITLWFKPRLNGPLRIEFEATAVSEGGPLDEVSDLNVFWMARNADGVEPVFARPRSGVFADYDDLLTYYVGLGGNRNTTSRFRRYVGATGLRPLLAEHDLREPSALLVPNKKQTITLIADRHAIEYKRDGVTLFRLQDPEPYLQGWFAFRSTRSHLRIEKLRIHSMR